MATIALEVSEELAARYRQASDSEQKRLALILATHLRSAFEATREETLDRLRKSMDRVATQAAANGLTEEILNDILDERRPS